MIIMDFIAVLSFGLSCFGLGYTLGKDRKNTQKQPPEPSKLSGYFCAYVWDSPFTSGTFSISILSRFWGEVKKNQ